MTAYKLAPIGDVAGVTEVLLREGEMSLGSDPVCEARVTADGVAGIHAAIFVGPDGVFIEPAQGALLINDAPAQGRTALAAGAFVWLGEPPAGVLMQLVAVEAPAEEVVEEIVEELPPPEPAVAEPAEVEEFEEAHVVQPAETAEVVEEIPEPAAPPLPPLPQLPQTPGGTVDDQVVEMVAEEAEAVLAEPAAADLPPVAPPPATVQAPPAPWAAAPRAAEPPAEQKQDLAAWEVKPPKPPEPAPEAPPAPAPTTPAAAPAASPKPAAKPPAPTAPPRPKAVAPPPKVVRAPAGATIPEPPPTRSGPNPAMLGIAAVLLIGGGAAAYFMLGSDDPAPVAQAPTPAPPAPPRVVATPVATPEPTPEASPEAVPPTEIVPPPVAEPSPVQPAPSAAGPTVGRPTPAGARPTPAAVRPTPTPMTARPTPVRPGGAQPAPSAAATAAPASPVPRLLEEARTAMGAKDWPRAQRAVDEVLRLEPANAEAATRKAEIAARVAARAKAFSTGATQVQGARPAGRGPAGFDVGGATVAQSDYMGQIQCATAPARVEEGDQYSVQCTLLNTGKRSFKIESIQAIEIADGARRTIPLQAPRGDLGPQERLPIAQHAAAWTAQREYRLEITVRTDKNTSFSATVNWR